MPVGWMEGQNPLDNQRKEVVLFPVYRLGTKGKERLSNTPQGHTTRAWPKSETSAWGCLCASRAQNMGRWGYAERN